MPVPLASRRTSSALASLAVGALLLSGCSGVASEGETTQVRFASMLPPDDAISQTIDAWMDDVVERTDDAVEFQHQYSGALLPGDEMLAGVGDRRADGGYVVPAYHPAELPLLNLAMVPVPFDSQTRARALQALIEENDAVAAELEDAGVHPVFFTMVASPWGLATREPVTDLEQLEGMRLRLLPGVTTPYEELGAEAVFISQEEQYESIQRGVVDGTLQPFDAWRATGIYEVAPHMLIHGIGAFGAGVVTMNAEEWESLDDDVKEAMEASAAESFTSSAEIFATEEAATCETIKAEGATVTSLDEEQVAAFQEAIGDSLVGVWRDAATGSGVAEETLDEVWAAYEGYLEEFAPDSTYESGMQACLTAP